MTEDPMTNAEPSSSFCAAADADSRQTSVGQDLVMCEVIGGLRSWPTVTEHGVGRPARPWEFPDEVPLQEVVITAADFAGLFARYAAFVFGPPAVGLLACGLLGAL